MRSENFASDVPVKAHDVLSDIDLQSLSADRPGIVRARPRHAILLPYGILIVCVGLVLYFAGVAMVLPRYLLDLDPMLKPISEWMVWYSGIPIVLGTAMMLIDLLILLDRKRRPEGLRNDPLGERRVTVALTAYNDEDSIGPAVEDFLAHPLVSRVIVVSNNSKDATYARAEAAGAITFNEIQPGYGRCVHRCLSEAMRFDDTEAVVLCEGDLTFRAYDIDKLLAYAAHGDIVNGTRTVEPLRQHSTQLTTFMYYGNLFVGKLLEAKHLGRCTITDVGTTYKLCRRESLRELLGKVDPAVNLEFNAHFLDTALGEGHTIIECPITFHPRVGVSKGGNINNLRGLKVGIRMMAGMLLGWKRLASA